MERLSSEAEVGARQLERAAKQAEALWADAMALETLEAALGETLEAHWAELARLRAWRAPPSKEEEEEEEKKAEAAAGWCRPCAAR